MKISYYAVRLFNEDIEKRENEIFTLANTYGVMEVKDRKRIMFFIFKTRRQAQDFADELYESYKSSVKVMEWFKESEE